MQKTLDQLRYNHKKKCSRIRERIVNDSKTMVDVVVNSIRLRPEYYRKNFMRLAEVGLDLRIYDFWLLRKEIWRKMDGVSIDERSFKEIIREYMNQYQAELAKLIDHPCVYLGLEVDDMSNHKYYIVLCIQEKNDLKSIAL